MVFVCTHSCRILLEGPAVSIAKLCQKVSVPHAGQIVLPSELKRLIALMLEGIPHVIEDLHSIATAQTRHKLQTRV